MKFHQLANSESITKAKRALEEKGYDVFNAKDSSEALEKIKEIIPDGATVMNGSSVTLETIGYTKYLESGDHKWINWHAKINGEDDKEKRHQLRRESVLSDYYVGSVHALTENGEYIVASNTGSQLPHIVYTSQNIIFVVSTKKIVSSLAEGLRRLDEYVVPLEDKHMQDLYKVNTALNKIVISKGEAPMIGRKVHFILVDEDLGF